ncbi:VOC family protein [Cohnella hashimotonis]|uniref:VOC family protein n=1 Tax=Cohnella hashimotonis TaxID=2826895 RepID=A0ABT6T9V5_9BACL|nr:VOC family protein [Cohnella hashimotonis]MDI4643607.1 VOC family protein [Cohnella hashimotonis]
MRIQHVQLLTKHLGQLKAFYINELGLPLAKDSDNTFTVGIGRSGLTFVQTRNAEDPFYHFAFDIPRNKIDESIAWLQSIGVAIHVFPDYSNRVYSESWNSTSIYFHDAGGNIVEFIARHDCGPDIDTPFTADSLISISEIGLVVSDVNKVKDAMHADCFINEYKNGHESFAAVGDEDGLFILSATGRVWLGSDIKAQVFKTEVTVEGSQAGVYAVGEYPYTLSFVGS